MPNSLINKPSLIIYLLNHLTNPIIYTPYPITHPLKIENKMMRGKKVLISNRNPSKRASCITLDKVLGITSRGNNSIATNPQTSEIAFIASGVICFYSPLTNKQESYIYNQNSKVFSCLTFSSNGKYLATGEGTCKQPEIAIWEISGPKQATLIKSLKGHKYGIESLAFSPDTQFLVSIGNEHDKGMFIWSWNQDKRVTSNKITKRILSLSFSPTGEFFITGGVKNIKMWSFDKGKPITTSSSLNAEIKCMASKNVDLAEMKEKNFVSVAVNLENVFALTGDGILCVFSKDRVMDKWMDLHAGGGFAIVTIGKYLVCGCAEGIIRCFDSENLEHIATLPRPPPLGQANISPDRKKMVIASEPNSAFADTMGLLLFDGNSKLYVLYSDRTVFIWDIARLDAITVYRAHLYHSAAINSIQILPGSTMDITLFVTGSNDKTIRFWHLCQADPTKTDSKIIRNVYSRELSRIIYVSKSFEHFKQKVPEGEGCIKCVACSPDGKHIASGDSEGNLRVHRFDDLEEMLCMTAHDSDIIALDYNSHTPREGECDKGKMYLASGSRDRLMHIFDVDNEYKPILTIDDHNSAISDIAFIRVDGSDKLISCGADRSLIFRTISNQSASRYYQTIQKSKKCYSIQPHPIHKTLIVGEDKSLKVLMMDSGKVVKEIEEYQEKGVKVVADSNYRVALDPSGLVFAVCNLDRTVRLIEYYSGKVLGKINVGEIVTSLVFTPNGKKLLTTTNDGCIFIWRLSIDLTNAIRARLAQAPIAKPIEIEELPERPKSNQDDIKQQLVKIFEEPAIRCHESIMPSWAKEEPSKKKSPFDVADEPSAIPGKWARGPIKIEFEDFEDMPKISEDLDFEESEKKLFAPLCLPDQGAGKGRDSFKVTKSIIGPIKNVKSNEDEEEEKEEEEVKEMVNDEIEEELGDEEEKLPELEPESTFVKNPMRQSLSSSFWRKKEEAVPPSVGLFQYEKVEVVPWNIPKVPVTKKKQDLDDLQAHINDAKTRLQDMGVLSIPKKSKQKGPELTKVQVDDSEIQEEIILDTQDDIPEEIKHSESPVSQPNPQKFNSPYNKNSVTESKSLVGFSLSESQFSNSLKLTKQQYCQGFSDLRKSLKDVDNYFSAIDQSDPEYSVSFEESVKERKEILELLVSISGKIGEPLGFSRENDIIEKFSKKLLSKVEKQLRKREKKRDRERDREREKDS